MYKTPIQQLREAFDVGDLERVKSLVCGGAEVFGGETLLMKACWSGHIREIVAYIVMSGGQFNGRDRQGWIALRQCAKQGKLESMKLLVESGVPLNMKYDDMTILQIVSERGREDFVEYLLGVLSSSRATKIECLELLGAACVDRLNDHASAHRHWLRSLEERDRAEAGDQVQPKSQYTHAAYGNSREFQTVEELDRMASSSEDMWMQALIIRGRILGPHNYYTSGHIRCRASAYYEVGNFERCLSLHKFLLESQIKVRGPKSIDHTPLGLSNLVYRFVDGMHDGYPVKYEDVMDVLLTSYNLLEFARSLNTPNSIEYNHVWLNYLIPAFITINVLDKLRPVMPGNDQSRFQQIVMNINKLNLHDAHGLTLLHLAGQYHDRSWTSLEVTKLLLDAGADPQAVDGDRNTPLHFLAKCYKTPKIELFQLLLSQGAHYDACNSDGKCFADYLSCETSNEIGNPLDYCTLQCLSAKAIVNYDIPYQHVLSSNVVQFVNLHSST